ncbi:hypothetical protein BTN50_0401 [Candidatus Enterovibrio altilux]|uniref:Uncharacterized protein n=1 Tax=Candidatus Enterovibrio altilux TaxID=1927128 RepID=A0A291B7F2_9GAMM|nr:hypothetical protein BTN50_0401 [Candidatus Enterovibrio luxaltus]
MLKGLLKRIIFVGPLSRDGVYKRKREARRFFLKQAFVCLFLKKF